MKIKVPNMTCNNCAGKIQAQLLTKGINAKFDVNNKIVEIKDNEYKEAVTAIKAAGYDVEA